MSGLLNSSFRLAQGRAGQRDGSCAYGGCLRPRYLCEENECSAVLELGSEALGFVSSRFVASQLSLLFAPLTWALGQSKWWIKVANKCCNGRMVSVLEGGYRVQGGIVSAFGRSVAGHVRAMVDGCQSRQVGGCMRVIITRIQSCEAAESHSKVRAPSSPPPVITCPPITLKC